MQASDHGLVDPFQHLDDLAFAPAAPVGAGFAHHDAVAMQHAPHLALGQEEVGRTVIRLGKAEAVAVADDARADQVQLVGDADRTLAVDDDFTVPLHRPQATGKECPFIITDAQHVAELFRVKRGAGIPQQVQHVFPARQRIGIFLFFPLQIGIAIPQNRRLCFFLVMTH